MPNCRGPRSGEDKRSVAPDKFWIYKKRGKVLGRNENTLREESCRDRALEGIISEKRNMPSQGLRGSSPRRELRVRRELPKGGNKQHQCCGNTCQVR